LRDGFGTVHEAVVMRAGLTAHEKPLHLPRIFIVHYTAPEEVVLDLFGGSGSTMIACEQTGRTCYSIEKDPHKVDVMIKRYEDFSHEKATLA
jgi:DNA modification methylase